MESVSSSEFNPLSRKLLAIMHFLKLLFSLAGLYFSPVAVPYNKYILAPDTCALHPATVHLVNGTVTNAASLTGNSHGSTVFKGKSSVAFGYGKNIAGIVSSQLGIPPREMHHRLDLREIERVIVVKISEELW